MRARVSAQTDGTSRAGETVEVGVCLRGVRRAAVFGTPGGELPAALDLPEPPIRGRGATCGLRASASEPRTPSRRSRPSRSRGFGGRRSRGLGTDLLHHLPDRRRFVRHLPLDQASLSRREHRRRDRILVRIQPHVGSILLHDRLLSNVDPGQERRPTILRTEAGRSILSIAEMTGAPEGNGGTRSALTLLWSKPEAAMIFWVRP